MDYFMMYWFMPLITLLSVIGYGLIIYAQVKEGKYRRKH